MTHLPAFRDRADRAYKVPTDGAPWPSLGHLGVTRSLLGWPWPLPTSLSPELDLTTGRAERKPISRRSNRKLRETVPPAQGH